MQAENSEEFYDVSVRNKKYGRVDAINGPVLLEKYVYKCISPGCSKFRNCNRFSNPVKQAHLRGTEPREGGEVYSIVTVWDQVLGRGQRERIAWIDLGRGCLQHRFRRQRISTRSTINCKS